MKKLLAGSCCALVALPAAAYTGYGSNLGYFDYPEFREFEPSPPYSREQWQAEQYRQEVETYLETAKRYVENCDSDKQTVLDEIAQKQKEAIRKANNVVDAYNDWLNGY